MGQHQSKKLQNAQPSSPHNTSPSDNTNNTQDDDTEEEDSEYARLEKLLTSHYKNNLFNQWLFLISPSLSDKDFKEQFLVTCQETATGVRSFDLRHGADTKNNLLSFLFRFFPDSFTPERLNILFTFAPNILHPNGLESPLSYAIINGFPTSILKVLVLHKSRVVWFDKSLMSPLLYYLERYPSDRITYEFFLQLIQGAKDDMYIMHDSVARSLPISNYVIQPDITIYSDLPKKFLSPKTLSEFLMRRSASGLTPLNSIINRFLTSQVPEQREIFFLIYNYIFSHCPTEDLESLDFDNKPELKLSYSDFRKPFALQKSAHTTFFTTPLGLFASKSGYYHHICRLLARGMTQIRPAAPQFNHEYNFLILYYTQLALPRFPHYPSILSSLFYHYNPLIHTVFRLGLIDIDPLQQLHLTKLNILMRRLQLLYMLVQYLPDVHAQEYIFEQLKISLQHQNYNKFVNNTNKMDPSNPFFIKPVNLGDPNDINDQIDQNYKQFPFRFRTVFGNLPIFKDQKAIEINDFHNLAPNSRTSSNSAPIEISRAVREASLPQLYNFVKNFNPHEVDYWDNFPEFSSIFSPSLLHEHLTNASVTSASVERNVDYWSYIVKDSGFAPNRTLPLIGRNNALAELFPPQLEIKIKELYEMFIQDTEQNLENTDPSSLQFSNLKHLYSQSKTSPIDVNDITASYLQTKNAQDQHNWLVLVENILYTSFLIWDSWKLYFSVYPYCSNPIHEAINRSRAHRTVLGEQNHDLEKFFLQNYPSTYDKTITQIDFPSQTIYNDICSSTELLSDGQNGEITNQLMATSAEKYILSSLYQQFYNYNPYITSRGDILPQKFDNGAQFFPLSMLDQIAIQSSGVIFRQPSEFLQSSTKDQYYTYLDSLMEQINGADELVKIGKKVKMCLEPNHIEQPGETLNFSNTMTPGLLWWVLLYTTPSYDDVMTLLSCNVRTDILSNTRQSTLMMAIAKHWDQGALIALARKMININLQDVYGRTALHYYFMCGTHRTAPDLFELLIQECGAVVNISDAFGHTPLTYALYTFADDDVVCKLIDYTLTRFPKQQLYYYQYFEPKNIKDYTQNIFFPLSYSDNCRLAPATDCFIEDYVKQPRVVGRDEEFEAISSAEPIIPHYMRPVIQTPKPDHHASDFNFPSYGVDCDVIKKNLEICHQDNQNDHDNDVIGNKNSNNGNQNLLKGGLDTSGVNFTGILNHPYSVNWLFYQSYMNDYVYNIEVEIVIAEEEHQTYRVGSRPQTVRTVVKMMDNDVDNNNNNDPNNNSSGKLLTLFGIMIRLRSSLRVIQHLFNRIVYGICTAPTKGEELVKLFQNTFVERNNNNRTNNNNKNNDDDNNNNTTTTTTNNNDNTSNNNDSDGNSNLNSIDESSSLVKSNNDDNSDDGQSAGENKDKIFFTQIIDSKATKFFPDPSSDLSDQLKDKYRQYSEGIVAHCTNSRQESDNICATSLLFTNVQAKTVRNESQSFAKDYSIFGYGIKQQNDAKIVNLPNMDLIYDFKDLVNAYEEEATKKAQSDPLEAPLASDSPERAHFNQLQAALALDSSKKSHFDPIEATSTSNTSTAGVVQSLELIPYMQLFLDTYSERFVQNAVINYIENDLPIYLEWYNTGDLHVFNKFLDQKQKE